jgi:hypothetical protein
MYSYQAPENRLQLEKVKVEVKGACSFALLVRIQNYLKKAKKKLFGITLLYI